MSSSSHAGVLSWGVRESFRGYVRALPDGSISPEGLAETGEDTFAFPIASTDREADGLVVRTEGRLTFEGHGGLLRLVVDAPRLVIGPERAELRLTQGPRDTVIAVGSETEPGRFAMTLSAHGSVWLGGQYPAGAPLDDIVVTPPSLLTAAASD